KASAYARDRQLYASHVTSTNPPGHGESVRASRMWWDSEATVYHDQHGDFLGAHSPEGEFIWCPEGLHEGDWHLLGDVAGRDVLGIGGGPAPCSRWLAGQDARAVAVDLSAGMLRVGAEAASRSTGPAATVPLIQADAGRLPFAEDSFDVVFSAFGAVPFVA